MLIAETLLIAALILLPGTAVADNPLLPGIQGNDDRVILEPAAWPWIAIGRVNRSIGGYCTGTLVGERTVLTAAHCLFNPKTQRFLPPDSLHFVAGYHRGEYIAHSIADSFELSPHYCQQCAPTITRMSNDWAIIRLAKPVGIRPISLANDMPENGNHLLQVGYSQDRPHLPTMHVGCRVVGFRQDPNLLLHDCDATRGDSGSPLLVRTEADWKIVAVHVGTTVTEKGTKYGIAVSMHLISINANR